MTLSQYPRETIDKIKNIKHALNVVENALSESVHKLERVTSLLAQTNEDLAIQENSVVYGAVIENLEDLNDENERLLEDMTELLANHRSIQKREQNVKKMLDKVNERFIKKHFPSKTARKIMSIEKWSHRTEKRDERQKAYNILIVKYVKT